MNDSNQLELVNTQIEEITAKLAKLQNEEAILSKLVKMEAEMQVLEASLSAGEEYKPYTIIDLPEEEYQWYKCAYACKINNEEDFNRCLYSTQKELTAVEKIIKLDSDVFADFKEDILGHHEWCENFGGSWCYIDLESKYPEHKDRMEGIGFVTLMDEYPKIRADWFRGLVQTGTLIVDRNNEEDFVIANQQGYNYLRYVSFPSHIIKTTKPEIK
jgi:hypothetical protein